ncbi:MAG: hypothetical protein ACR2KV_05775 [Solirubrobacteraceae bacterium]
MSLSGHARHQIVALRREADGDVHAGLDYATLDVIPDLATRFRAVLDTNLSHRHVGEDHEQSFRDVKEHPAG